MPTAVEAVNLARSEGLICAIASSSGSAEIYVALEALELSHCFSVVVTGEDVKRPKPSPDVYDVAVERLGVRSDECVAVEDSQIGLAAAIAAGLAVIAVPNDLTRTHDFARASARAESVLEAVKAVVIGI
jgi:HAD superfamily hydrolase (TIGR01509 family)